MSRPLKYLGALDTCQLSCLAHVIDLVLCFSFFLDTLEPHHRLDAVTWQNPYAAGADSSLTVPCVENGGLRPSNAYTFRTRAGLSHHRRAKGILIAIRRPRPVTPSISCYGRSGLQGVKLTRQSLVLQRASCHFDGHFHPFSSFTPHIVTNGIRFSHIPLRYRCSTDTVVTVAPECFL